MIIVANELNDNEFLKVSKIKIILKMEEYKSFLKNKCRNMVKWKEGFLHKSENGKGLLVIFDHINQLLNSRNHPQNLPSRLARTHYNCQKIYAYYNC